MSQKVAQTIGGRDSTPVRGVPYEPIALLRVYRAKIESNSSQSRGIGCAPRVQSCYTTSSNRSSDDNNKIHKIEALLLESKIESPLYKSNDYLISQVPRYPLGRPKQSFHLPYFSQSLRYYYLPTCLPTCLLPTYLLPTFYSSTTFISTFFWFPCPSARVP